MSREDLPVHPENIVIPFRSVDAGHAPGAAIEREFRYAWPAYRRWYLHEGEARRPTYAECRRAIRRHLPELLAEYDAVVAAVGGGDLQARFLSHWNPPPLATACSLAVWPGPEPALMRNYDYPPSLCDALALRTHWQGRTILGMADCAWGLVDGMNDAGLAIATAFGGRRVVGSGFGIGLVIRYLLTVCSTTAEVAARLESLPVQMSYNLGVVDATADARMLAIAPDRPVWQLPGLSAANRQGETEWPEHADYCGTVDREWALTRLLDGPEVTEAALEEAFVHPPLHRPLDASTWGTVYTAVYTRGGLTLRWPDDSWHVPLNGSSQEEHPRMATVLVPDPVQAPPVLPTAERRHVQFVT